jgi:hypothetical protein
MKKLAEKHRVQAVITSTRLQRPDLHFNNDVHWNAKGHEVVALQVLDAISASGVLSQ